MSPGEVRIYRSGPGHDVAREALALRLGMRPGDIFFKRTCPVCGGPHGKPVLDPAVHGAGAPQFSLSRSGTLVLLAVADTPVGIDVEVHREVDAVGIAGRMFSAPEAALVAALDPEPRISAFMQLWTRKEALGKAAGAGLTEEILATNVIGPPGLVILDGRGSWVLIDLDAGDAATAALATRPGVEKVVWASAPPEARGR